MQPNKNFRPPKKIKGVPLLPMGHLDMILGMEDDRKREIISGFSNRYSSPTIPFYRRTPNQEWPTHPTTSLQSFVNSKFYSRLCINWYFKLHSGNFSTSRLKKDKEQPVPNYGTKSEPGRVCSQMVRTLLFPDFLRKNMVPEKFCSGMQTLI